MLGTFATAILYLVEIWHYEMHSNTVTCKISYLKQFFLSVWLFSPHSVTQHHKSTEALQHRNAILQWYYSIYPLFGYCCVGTECFYICLYYLHHYPNDVLDKVRWYLFAKLLNSIHPILLWPTTYCCTPMWWYPSFSFLMQLTAIYFRSIYAPDLLLCVLTSLHTQTNCEFDSIAVCGRSHSSKRCCGEELEGGVVERNKGSQSEYCQISV